jgi:hypothetical protein
LPQGKKGVSAKGLFLRGFFPVQPRPRFGVGGWPARAFLAANPLVPRKQREKKQNKKRSSGGL